jgi:hypothetical protein
MRRNQTTTFPTLAVLTLAALAGAGCDLTKANPAAPTSPTAPTTPSTPAPAVTEWTIEVEAGTGDGPVMPRSNASKQRTVSLLAGQRRDMSFTAPVAGLYRLALAYANDNPSPQSEDVTITATLVATGEQTVVGHFVASNTGNGNGAGWNSIVVSQEFVDIPLAAAAYRLSVAVTGGDNFGFEGDCLLVRRQ